MQYYHMTFLIFVQRTYIKFLIDKKGEENQQQLMVRKKGEIVCALLFESKFRVRKTWSLFICARNRLTRHFCFHPLKVQDIAKKMS